MIESCFSSLAQLCAALSDEESHQILRHRLTYSLGQAGGQKSHPTEWPLAGMVALLGNTAGGTLLTRLLEEGPSSIRPLVLFGAGQWGAWVLEWLRQQGTTPRCFCDNDSSKQGQLYEGLPVISVDDLTRDYRECLVLIAVNEGGGDPYRQLVSAGFPEDQIIANIGRQYFEPFLPRAHNETFVDAGGYDGATSLDFSRWRGKNFAKIHLFEPDSRWMPLCRKNLAVFSEDKVSFHLAGLWSQGGQLGFSPRQARSSGLAPESDDTVAVVALDDIFCDSTPTFIKMDIEGAELEALKGAKNILRRCKPKLAISVYHKPEDIMTIPLWILQVVPEYRLYLRHYSLFVNETVLYAVPKEDR